MMIQAVDRNVFVSEPIHLIGVRNSMKAFAVTSLFFVLFVAFCKIQLRNLA